MYRYINGELNLNFCIYEFARNNITLRCTYIIKKMLYETPTNPFKHFTQHTMARYRDKVYDTHIFSFKNPSGTLALYAV